MSVIPTLILVGAVWFLVRVRARNKRRFDALSPEQKRAERKRRANAMLWD